jgi:hypothetical protein
MKERVQGAVTAGVAIVGAGVMAAAPAAQQAPEVLRSVEANIELTAASNNPVDAAVRLSQGLGESGLRLAGSLATSPLGLLPIGEALVEGDDPNGRNQALFDALVPYLDGTNYAIDPTIFALDDVLPAPYGQDPSTTPNDMGGSELTRFRANVLLAARDDIDEAVADALGVGEETDVDDEGAIYAAARLGAGFAASGVRAARSAVAAPLGLVGVAQGVQQSFETGDNTLLYKALEAYVDGPNYVLDPVVFAADDVVPGPVGSDPSVTPNNMGGSQISQFRANVLLAARDEVRGAVKGALGVDSVTNLGTSAREATKGTKGTELASVAGGGSNSAGSTRAASPKKSFQDTIKSINQEFKATADGIDRATKKFTSGNEVKQTKATAKADDAS